jgi:hypothetical protein
MARGTESDKMTKKIVKYPVITSPLRPYVEVKNLFQHILKSPGPAEYKIVPLMILAWVLMLPFSRSGAPSLSLEDYKSGILNLLQKNGQLPKLTNPTPPGYELTEEIKDNEQQKQPVSSTSS